MLIAIHSRGSRAGKSTAAQFLVNEYGFNRFSFGSEIYKEVAAAYGIPIEYLYDDEWKRTAKPQLALEHCTDKEFVHMIQLRESKVFGIERVTLSPRVIQIPRTARFILQQWATEYKRSQDSHYWIKKTNDQLVRLELGEHIVIDDLRDPLELDYVEDFARLVNPMPLYVPEVVRPGMHVTEHSSDKGLPHHKISVVWENTGDIPFLYDQIANFMEDKKWKKR